MAKDRRPHRYGAVLILTLALLIFLIAAPEANWSKIVGMALQAGTLLAIVATSGAPRPLRRLSRLGAAVVTIAVVAAIATGDVPAWTVSTAGAIFAIAALPSIAYGVVELIRSQGVTLQAVAGGLTAYLMVGLLFAFLIGAIAHWGPAYFNTGGDGTVSIRAYFSFTTLTTTGFGDYTAVTNAGRALAVVEGLTGQLYLVTVVAVMVGHLSRRARDISASSM
jgi:hypothetical protein